MGFPINDAFVAFHFHIILSGENLCVHFTALIFICQGVK